MLILKIYIVVKRELGNGLPRNIIQRQWRERNPQEAKESDKRVYLKKKAVQYGFGENNVIIDRWMEEWQQTGKVSYSYIGRD